MFKKRAYQNVNEDKRRKDEKEQLTHHFHRSLKCLQQKEHVDGATIVSNEASNNLCNVLEAVFLHGIKDTMVSKLVSYAQGSSNESKINFWGVVKKFTHKDVIEQLRTLSQINTDIGLCRSWVRLAINDGLMASYLASMTADNKALTTFYYTWAYLLDYEQPEILRNHLTGLMGLNFNLSINSNILNKWSSTTVSLAALMTTEPQAPLAVVRSGTPTPPSSRRHSQSSTASMDSLQGKTDTTSTTTTTTSTTTTTTAAALTVPSHQSQVYTITTTPPNTPANSLVFRNSDDVDAIRRLADRFRSTSVSSGSSGQASCPDPSEPHTDEPGGLRPDTGPLSSRSSRSNSPLERDREGSRGSPYGSMAFMSRESRKFDEQLKLKALLDRMDQREQEREEREREKERENSEKQTVKERIQPGQSVHSNPFPRRSETREEEKVGAKEESNRRPALQQEDVATRGDWRGSQRVVGQQLNPGRSSVSPPEQTAAKNQPQSRGNDWVHASAVVDSIEDAITTLPGEGNDTCETGESAGERTGEDAVLKEREATLGNCLSARDGWTTMSPCHRPSVLEQSYESMLRGYQAQRGSVNAIATVDDVIDGMPDAHLARGKVKAEPEKEPFSAEDGSEEEIDFTDYEIIPSASEDSDAERIQQMKSLCNYVGKNAQNNVCATPTCNMGVGFFHGPGQICHLDGRTYCEQCHLSQHAYIPAEIIYNWNFKKKKVCTSSYLFLQRVQDQPVVDIDEMSMAIYSTVSTMRAVMLLRTRLTSLRSYMFTCSEATAVQLKDRVWPREHLYNKVHSYSVSDLLEVRSGRLEVFLKEVVDMCQKHVYSCSLCLAKGFYCELCRDPKPIFPFEIDSTLKCKLCKNVYHARCKTDTIPCPKCVRYTERGLRRQTDFDDDYSCSPE